MEVPGGKGVINQRYGKVKPILREEGRSKGHLAIPVRHTSQTTMDKSLTNKKKGGILMNSESVEDLDKTHDVIDSEHPIHLLSQVSINSIQKLEELEELTKMEPSTSPIPINSRQAANFGKTMSRRVGIQDSSILSIRGMAQPKSYLTLAPVIQSPKPPMKIKSTLID